MMTNRSSLKRLLGGAAVAVLGFGIWLVLIRPEPGEPPPSRPGETRSESPGNTPRKTAAPTIASADTDTGESSFSLEEAKERMRKALSIRDALKRTAETSIIIEKLCFAGLVEEAWELIDKNSGQVRNSQIRIFFRSAQLDPAAFFGKFQQLELRDERTRAFTGQLSGYGKEGLLDFINSPLTKAWLAEGGEAMEILRQALRRSLFEKITLPIDKEERTDARDLALRFHSEGMLDSNNLAQLLQKDAYLKAGEKLAMLTQAAPEFTSGSLGSRIRKDLVEEAVDEDAERTLNEISARGSEKQGHVNLFNALRRWGVIDPFSYPQFLLR